MPPYEEIIDRHQIGVDSGQFDSNYQHEQHEGNQYNSQYYS
jgi:hypothetical protein